MEDPPCPAPTPVAFWRSDGQLWIEFSDGHSQGFRSARQDAGGYGVDQAEALALDQPEP